MSAQSKDASWHAFVTNLLGPAQKLNFKEESKRRAHCNGYVSSKIVPNDDQCRYLWRFHTLCSNDDVKQNQGFNNADSVSRADDYVYCSIDQVHNDGTDSAPSVLIIEESSTMSLDGTKSMTKSKESPLPTSKTLTMPPTERSIKSNRVSLSPSRKRPWPARSSSPPWILRSKFYDDSKPSARKGVSRDARVLMEQECDCDKRVLVTNVAMVSSDQGTAGLRSESGADDLKRRSKRDCNADATQPVSPTRKQQTDHDDSSIEQFSPEDKLSANQVKRQKKKLFRPSAKRANNRLKQRSIMHIFAKK